MIRATPYRSVLTALICLALLLLLFAARYTPARASSETQPAVQEPRFIGEVREVTTPVTVSDHHGNPVNGLQPGQFRLMDNGAEQKIHVDNALEPITMVVAVQSNAGVEPILPAVRRIPSC